MVFNTFSRYFDSPIDCPGEWDIFANCDEAYFNHFSQLVILFHGLNAWTEQKEKALSRLNEKYYIFHIHAHNVIPGNGWDSGYPDLLTISYIRKDVLDFLPSSYSGSYPIKGLDVKNKSNGPNVRFNWW